jgi:hypothetical protein
MIKMNVYFTWYVIPCRVIGHTITWRVKINWKKIHHVKGQHMTHEIHHTINQGRIHVGPGGKLHPEFWKIVFFGNLLLPLNCLIIFIEKKIFNIMHNEIIMQRYQNIKFCKRKLSSSTWFSIILSFILLLFLIYKMLLF